ncbi:tail terminator [Arthrobacter phage Idaho]|uniref:Tail terminator n=1 Tax=Arthrobacter phage Idaho TaxID=2565509 RepID=A0A4D6TFA8_9CAUD|nr:tail terminator [Arthrobacter phage Idaho]QCG78272.1 tail terminator [Arthrobacter phage Idaho]
MTALSLSAAEQLRDKLQAALDAKKWKWVAAPEEPANVNRQRFGAVWRTRLAAASNGRLDTELVINIYGAKAAPGEATERELDDALDQVLLVLQAQPGIKFQEATRVVFKEVFAGWDVRFSVNHNNFYAEQVRKNG